MNFIQKGCPGGSAGKESACKVGNQCWIPGLGKSLGEGNSYPLQCSGLQNSTACIVRGAVESETTDCLSLLRSFIKKSCYLQYILFTSFLCTFFFIYFYQLEANDFTILQWFLLYIDMNQPWIYITYFLIGGSGDSAGKESAYSV